MKRIIAGLIVGCGMLFLSGCAPEEKELCSHLMTVWGDKTGKPRYLEDMGTCIDYQADKKKRRGVNSYRREAECVLAADTVYVVRRCEQREEKKHG